METNKPFMKNVVEAIRTLQHAVHKNAVDHGWWEGERSDGEIERRTGVAGAQHPGNHAEHGADD